MTYGSAPRPGTWTSIVPHEPFKLFRAFSKKQAPPSFYNIPCGHFHKHLQPYCWNQKDWHGFLRAFKRPLNKTNLPVYAFTASDIRTRRFLSRTEYHWPLYPKDWDLQCRDDDQRIFTRLWIKRCRCPECFGKSYRLNKFPTYLEKAPETSDAFFIFFTCVLLCFLGTKIYDSFLMQNWPCCLNVTKKEKMGLYFAFLCRKTTMYSEYGLALN